MLSATVSALAFAPQSRVAFGNARVNPIMQATPEAPEVPVAPLPPPPPPPPAITTMRVGDKTLAGDWGFDPLGLADSSDKLAWYREAEVKHARLAMLAAAGWPIAELLNGPLSAAFGVDSLLTKSGQAPSILNGGLGGVPLPYWLAVIGAAIFVEGKTIDFQLNTGKRPERYLPGMLEFDPLNMDSPSMRNAEIQNGRIAMIAITLFALEEAIFHVPVVKETPFFFQPFWN